MMRMACALTVGSLAAGLASGAQAQTPSRQGLEVGIEGYRYDYEGATVVEDKGRLFGLTLDYGRAVAAWELRAKGRAAGGLVDYRSDEGDRLDDVVHATVQVELQAGRSMRVSPGVTLTPFIGLGARGHGDSSGGLTTDTGLEGYDRYIFYAYAPLGLAADIRAAARTTVSLSAQYNLFLGGDAVSELSKLDPGAPDIEVELEDGSGWEFAASVNRKAGRGVLSVGPFIRYWKIGRSTSQRFEDDEVSIDVFEPPNRTVEAGLKLAYRF